VAHRIAVLGTGYVGLITAVGLADFGNRVVGVDIDKGTIARLSRGEPTIYEHGLIDYLDRNLKSGRLTFTTDTTRALRESEVILVAVGTPPKGTGETDLSQVEAVCEQIGRALDSYRVIVIKSTVPVGTNLRVREAIARSGGGTEFAVVSNPEFLREGSAIQDFFHPDRVVVGCNDARARQVVEDIYRPLYLTQTPFVWCDPETAELIKYASNAFLAVKISYINQIANFAESVGADIRVVSRAMGMDGRIGAKFLHPGPGFGGSCLPKDIRGLAWMARQAGVELSVVEEAARANEEQKMRMMGKLEGLLPLRDSRVCVLGLAFKSETDDVRESPAIVLVSELLRSGAEVRAHDPKAVDNFRKLFPDISYFEDMSIALTGADAVVIATDWNEYRNMDLVRAKQLMRGDLLLDTRNVLDPDKALEAGFRYHCVGRRFG
jgi:UDPglucose 6-dehydrogenase